MNTKKYVVSVLLLVASWGLSGQALAKTKVTVKLESITLLEPQESNRDEIYFSITEYLQDQSSRHYQIPSFPTHWLSSHLQKITDIVLWQGEISECQPIDVVFSLVEKDFKPWNIDDLLGTLKLKIQCQGEAITTQWITSDKRVLKSQNEGVFLFHGDGAKYQASFSLEKSKVGET